MSAATAQAIDAAVRAHIADEADGQLAVGWALVVARTNVRDDGHDYVVEAPEWQPAHHTIGLLRLGTDMALQGDVDGGPDD